MTSKEVEDPDVLVLRRRWMERLANTAVATALIRDLIRLVVEYLVPSLVLTARDWVTESAEGVTFAYSRHDLDVCRPRFAVRPTWNGVYYVGVWFGLARQTDLQALKAVINEKHNLTPFLVSAIHFERHSPENIESCRLLSNDLIELQIDCETRIVSFSVNHGTSINHKHVVQDIHQMSPFVIINGGHTTSFDFEPNVNR